MTEQDEGKFCGTCGTTLQSEHHPQPAPEQVLEAESHTQASTASMATTSVNQGSRAKHQSNQFLTFYKNVSKSPRFAEAASQSNPTYGIVTVILFSAIMSLSIYTFANKMFQLMSGGFDYFSLGLGFEGMPFFPIFMPIFLLTLAFVGCAIISSWIMVKTSGSSIPLKETAAHFGGLLVPFISVSILSLLLSLIGMLEITVYLNPLILSFTLFLYPALVVYQSVNQKTEKALYWSLGASLLSILFMYIFIRFAILNTIREIVDYMML